MALDEFSAEPLPHPMAFQVVREGHYASATFTPETTHLATFGLMTCKAVSLYDPNAQSGLLAHIDGTVHPERIINTIVENYEGNIAESEVRIVQAVQDEHEMLWPTIDALAKILMDYGPRNLRVDRNKRNVGRRDIALCLKSGLVYEAEQEDGMAMRSISNLKPSTPLRSSDLQL